MGWESFSGRRRSACGRESHLPPIESTRPLVVVVRDAHRHPWQRELAVPGSVVVETGLPEWRPPDARAFVATYGAGRANLQAAADLLAGG